MGAHKSNPIAVQFTRLTPQTRDQYNRVLRPGDEVIFATFDPPRFAIKDVRPVVDPGAPPNMVRVVLVATADFLVPADRPVMEMIRTRTAEETGWGAVPEPSVNGTGPGPGDPPPPPPDDPKPN